MNCLFAQAYTNPQCWWMTEIQKNHSYLTTVTYCIKLISFICLNGVPYHANYLMCLSKLSNKSHDDLPRPIDFDLVHNSLLNKKCDYIDPTKCIDLNLNGYNLVALQLNIRSLLSNITELKQLLITLEQKRSRVDIVLLCKTFVNQITCKLVNIPNYDIVSNHRQNNKGGGTAILIHKDITYKCQKDFEFFKENCRNHLC